MKKVRRGKALIIGSGPAGHTAAVYAARAMLEPVLVQGVQPGGQLSITTEVENWPGQSQIQGPDLMQMMEAHARSVGTEIVADQINRLDLPRRPFLALGDTGTGYTADAVVLTTGAQAKWLGLPSEEKFKAFGVSACATCDGFFYRGREVVVIDGGDTAFEEALFLTNFASKVTLAHRRDTLRCEKILEHQLLKNAKVDVVRDHQVEEIIGTSTSSGVEGVRLTHMNTGQTTETPCAGVFVAIGHALSSKLVADQLETRQGG